MEKLIAAIKEFKKLQREGWNPKLLWHYRTQSWYVAYIWFPTMSGFYKRIDMSFRKP